MTIDEKITRLEASILRLERLDEEEVESDEYERILAELVALRERRDRAPNGDE